MSHSFSNNTTVDQSIRTSPVDTAMGELQVKQENIGERLAYLETRLAGVLTQIPKGNAGEAGATPVTEVGKSHLHECLLGAGRRADRHIDAIESMLNRLTV